ncbi:apolipoprotein L3-like isoform X1 [Trichechus manatus latirostris]|uniref:Apolipoprotein L3-like isoform X1 n=1 Tax=Trichechus manatus latirostris TaxID=127582 RepID=A0A2Y9QZM8_TRIMA|nr:apolipoprotein L3-like isoform X1 [Trichechus manatus latirostris]
MSMPLSPRRHQVEPPRESQDITEGIIEYLKNNLTEEELQNLLAEDQNLESIKAEVDLSRDEEDALYEALNQLRKEIATEDKDSLQKEQQHRHQFLQEFPRVKMKLEEHIRELHALADKVGKIHRDCTISHIVANSTSTVSGILTILGLALAPVTAGVSLPLCATGVGLGVAAAITSVSTSIVDHSARSSAKAKASKLMSTGDCEHAVNAVRPSLVSTTESCNQASSNIRKNDRAKELAKLLVTNHRCLMTSGTISIQIGNPVQKTIASTALKMAKGARVMGMATVGVFLLIDVVSLVQESKHLHEGAKTESAEELREQARELERKLEELTEIYKNLLGTDSMTP